MVLLSNITKSSNAQGGDWTSMLLLVGIMVVFILVMIIPQRKRDKKVKEMLANIKEGNKVRTIGGIYGKVVKIDGDKIILESAEGTQIEFARGAISTVENSDVESNMDVKSK